MKKVGFVQVRQISQIIHCFKLFRGSLRNTITSSRNRDVLAIIRVYHDFGVSDTFNSTWHPTQI